MKKIIFGFLLGVMLVNANIGSIAGNVVEVVFNKVNIAVNGQKVDADNILYNGTTYVPLRKVAEILEKKVTWNSKTNTAGINDKDYVELVANEYKKFIMLEGEYVIDIRVPEKEGEFATIIDDSYLEEAALQKVYSKLERSYEKDEVIAYILKNDKILINTNADCAKFESEAAILGSGRIIYLDEVENEKDVSVKEESSTGTPDGTLSEEVLRIMNK